jgi:hypothetical protein
MTEQDEMPLHCMLIKVSSTINYTVIIDAKTNQPEQTWDGKIIYRPIYLN